MWWSCVPLQFANLANKRRVLESDFSFSSVKVKELVMLYVVQENGRWKIVQGRLRKHSLTLENEKAYMRMSQMDIMETETETHHYSDGSSNCLESWKSIVVLQLATTLIGFKWQIFRSTTETDKRHAVSAYPPSKIRTSITNFTEKNIETDEL